MKGPYRDDSSIHGRLEKCESHVEELFKDYDNATKLCSRSIIIYIIVTATLVLFGALLAGSYREEFQDKQEQIDTLSRQLSELEHSIPLQNVRCRLEVTNK